MSIGRREWEYRVKKNMWLGELIQFNRFKILGISFNNLKVTDLNEIN